MKNLFQFFSGEEIYGALLYFTLFSICCGIGTQNWCLTKYDNCFLCLLEFNSSYLHVKGLNAFILFKKMEDKVFLSSNEDYQS